MIRINLAPRDDRRARRGPRLRAPRLRVGALLGLAGLALAGALGGYGWHLAREDRRLTAETESAARELAALKATVAPAVGVKERLADLQARLAAIELVTRDQGRPLRLVDAFVDAVPPDLWVTGLEERGALLRVTGSAFSAQAVANFMSALRASGRFKDIDIVVSKQDLAKTPSLVSFEVTCRFAG